MSDNVHIVIATLFCAEHCDTACNVKLALERIVHLPNILNTA